MSTYNYSFEKCTALEGVYITDLSAFCNIQFPSYDSNPLYYAHKLYLNNEYVDEIVIPDNVTTVKNNVFCGCDAKRVTIHSGVTSIGTGLASHMNDLEELVFEDGINITKFPDRALYYCKKLTTITIPPSVTTIGAEVARYCDALEKIYILGEGVTKIDTRAFEQRERTYELYIKTPTPPTLAYDALTKYYKYQSEPGYGITKIAVPIGSGDAYKAATNWSSFANYIVEEEF